MTILHTGNVRAKRRRARQNQRILGTTIFRVSVTGPMARSRPLRQETVDRITRGIATLLGESPRLDGN